MKVPRLSRNAIELKAEEVIGYFSPKVLEEPQLTSIRSFVLQSVKEFGIRFDMTSDLGTTKHGTKILGEFTFKPRTIRIDKSLMDDPRFDFTLAHEFGHLVLHRKIYVTEGDYTANEMKDTERDLVTGHRILKTPRDWIEWQANQFAAAILIPRATIRNAITEKQRELGIKRNIGIILLEKHNYSHRDYHDMIEHLCGIYMVPRTVMRNRLKSLSILEDVRDKNIKHISQLFREE